LEPRHTVCILRELFRQHLDRHIPAQSEVLGLAPFIHATLAERTGDIVMYECFPDHGHKSLWAKMIFMVTGESWG
jgi:hypothetical protein